MMGESLNKYFLHSLGLEFEILFKQHQTAYHLYQSLLVADELLLI